MRYRHGLVLGKFYPLHAGHVALIRAALACCDRVSVQVLASSAESLPADVRASWIREELPTAHVTTVLDDEPVDYASEQAWDAHLALIRTALDAPVDVVLTSDGYGSELARRLGAAWQQVDPGRVAVPVSGRAVRADPGRWWWALTPAVRAWFARRIVVLGAESTGTTTLAGDLAAALGVAPVLEFGREWTVARPGGLTAPWHTAEFDLVAREQAAREDRALRTTPLPLVVCDTDTLATTVWHERYVGHASPSVVAVAAGRVPDLYLLTGDEIPFVQDGLRDGEHLRRAMTGRFRDVLTVAERRGGAPWHELHGSREERLAAALRLVRPLLEVPRFLADPLPERGVDAFD